MPRLTKGEITNSMRYNFIGAFVTKITWKERAFMDGQPTVHKVKGTCFKTVKAEELDDAIDTAILECSDTIHHIISNPAHQ